ncbi:type ISP restriction/modification enzyme [Neolewinella antarctica]|uniref:Type ISP restriction-modification enzyme LLaBIII C-terminal specificity domain-containing protein n=1 Tax=Neolewinella antarctica TaxID=442734 RepID=A0ABX0X9E9_9BACT|nr:hypothetical protein [Neolewinella antarctica]
MIFSYFHPRDTFDYIHAMLHNPGCRESYAEFLKVDLPYVPYFTDTRVLLKVRRVVGVMDRSVSSVRCNGVLVRGRYLFFGVNPLTDLVSQKLNSLYPAN